MLSGELVFRKCMCKVQSEKKCAFLSLILDARKWNLSYLSSRSGPCPNYVFENVHWIRYCKKLGVNDSAIPFLEIWEDRSRPLPNTENRVAVRSLLLIPSICMYTYPFPHSSHNSTKNTVRIPMILQFRECTGLILMTVVFVCRPIPAVVLEVSGLELRNTTPVTVRRLHPGPVMEITESQ